MNWESGDENELAITLLRLTIPTSRALMIPPLIEAEQLEIVHEVM